MPKVRTMGNFGKIKKQVKYNPKYRLITFPNTQRRILKKVQKVKQGKYCRARQVPSRVTNLLVPEITRFPLSGFGKPIDEFDLCLG